MPYYQKLTTTTVSPPSLRKMTLADRVVGIALSQIGMDFSKYPKYERSSIGSPKDYSFIHWCYSMACSEENITCPLPSGITHNQLHGSWSKKFLVPDTPVKGDLILTRDRHLTLVIITSVTASYLYAIGYDYETGMVSRFSIQKDSPSIKKIIRL